MLSGGGLSRLVTLVLCHCYYFARYTLEGTALKLVRNRRSEKPRSALPAQFFLEILKREDNSRQVSQARTEVIFGDNLGIVPSGYTSFGRPFVHCFFRAGHSLPK
jgi:hypothetical protein